MVICHSCGQKVKWSVFKREICPACSKPWNGLVAGVNTSHCGSDQTVLPSSQQEFCDLSSLLSSIRVQEPVLQEIQVFSDIWAPGGYPTRSFVLSILLHIGLIGLLYGLSGLSFSQPLPLTKEALERDFTITYYRPSDLLPMISPAKEGPKEAAGEKRNIKPPKGSTAFHPTQIVQSAPPKPDNPSQTIVQPSTPQVEIKEEVKVPNIVVWNIEESKVDSMQIDTKQITPVLTPKINTPTAAMRPPDPELKTLDQNLSDLKIARTEALNLQPKLIAHPGASPEWAIGSDAGNPGPLLNVPGGSAGADQLRNVVVLSANPGLPGPGGLKVPPGNKTGGFSISPEGNRAGSPDGVDGGILGGGVPGGGGSGKGDGSGFGSAGNIARIQIPGLSVKGGSNNGVPTVSGPGKRPRAPGGFSDMVTIDDPGESYNITVVESRTGGAGLGVYGVLSGKRNYTVFIPMPAGRWIMQFSEMPGRDPQPAAVDTPVVQSQVFVAAGDALVQPRPLRKVDPGRPEDEELAKLRGVVVLYAVIRKDGGVDKIRIVRSLNPALDERAVEALREWKFKPAQQGDNPVEVQALFGIPFRPQPSR
jgi:TonB family protein